MTQPSQELWTALVMALGRVEGAIAANRQVTADGLAALGTSMDRRLGDLRSETRAGFERCERDLAQVVMRMERGMAASRPASPGPHLAPTSAHPPGLGIVQRLERLKAVIAAVRSLPWGWIAGGLFLAVTALTRLLPVQMAEGLRPLLGPLKDLAGHLQ